MSLQIIFLVVFITVIVFEVVTKRKLASDQVSQDPLSGKEKLLAWILCIFNPILAGAILYYGWKKRLPVKAKQANSISWKAFILAIVLSFILIGLWPGIIFSII